MSQIDFAFLDSGTGGIPYMLYLKEKCPASKCVYLGDTANFPYGEKSTEQIIDCSTKAVDLLISHFAPKAIVVACNTISVTALDSFRKTFPNIPFVGTVPAIKLASSISKKRRIGLLATRQSINHPYTQQLINDFSSDCYVAKRGDPDLIDFIEKKLFTATEEEITNAIMPAINFFKAENVDTIILGCTHFLHISKQIEALAGSGIKIVDSREGVAKQALKVINLSAVDSAGCTGAQARDCAIQARDCAIQAHDCAIKARDCTIQARDSAGCESSRAGSLATNGAEINDKTFFVTSENQSKAEYELLSKKLNLSYSGLLK